MKNLRKFACHTALVAPILAHIQAEKTNSGKTFFLKNGTLYFGKRYGGYIRNKSSSRLSLLMLHCCCRLSLLSNIAILNVVSCKKVEKLTQTSNLGSV